ncbi:hypothetical protein PHLH8_37920 [Pseudomonas sp. Pc102]|uniref:hypothetical protein n=1 Tax=Pseudomonas sp. Pc102 TaxID=2678261 RepID=UPI001BD04310|nr:hypothetical protein [Pseudomonas sp. Pc102]BBP84150.1 hypothetical protein PHLH8_37920 [Pseudomonas sp. Pc102]
MVDHVNAVSGLRWQPYRGESVRNCAACTAAGAVNLTLGHSSISSSHVAQARNTGDCQTTMGPDTKAQAIAIADYVAVNAGRKAIHSGDSLDRTDAEAWMRGQPEKTVFAVLASGFVPHDSENKCHWLNAILAGGTLRYFDFQTMRPSRLGGDFVGSRNPSTSTAPFVGVITQSQNDANHWQMHSAQQPGSFDGSVKLTVIAFPPA